LGYKQGIEAMLLSFDEHYQGDRVFALMVGMVGMVRKSYNDFTLICFRLFVILFSLLKCHFAELFVGINAGSAIELSIIL
jgi:hypothetical protein